MANTTTFHTFHTLLIHLQDGLPDALPAFVRQQKSRGVTVRFMEPSKTLASCFTKSSEASAGCFTEQSKASASRFTEPSETSADCFFTEPSETSSSCFTESSKTSAGRFMWRSETSTSCFSRHKISPEHLLLISDTDETLAAARKYSIAAAGFQRADAPYLSAPYLFQDFTEDLGDYLRLAYCRFHGLPFTIACTPRLILRETCQEDLAPLAKIYNESDGKTDSGITGSSGTCKHIRVTDTTRWFFPDHEPEAFLDAYIRTMYGLYQLGMYTVVRRSDNAVIGHCGFDLKASPLSSSREVPFLGYILSGSCRRQGYALEACRACLEYLSDYTDYREAFCAVPADNSASLKLARRLGFRSLVILTDHRPHTAGFQSQLPAGHACQLILRNQL